MTPVAETVITFNLLSSCTDCVDEAAGGAFWAPPAENDGVREARWTYVP